MVRHITSPLAFLVLGVGGCAAGLVHLQGHELSAQDPVGKPQARFALTYYRFPGRAGELQDRGDVNRLAAEVGANYGAYHSALADRMEELGGRPDRRSFGHDVVGYARAYNELMDVLVGEQAIREARAAQMVRAGDDPGDWQLVPLVDERHRLVSVEGDDEARKRRRGSDAAAAWVPPAPTLHT